MLVPPCVSLIRTKKTVPPVSVCVCYYTGGRWKVGKYMYTINRKWLEANHTLWIIDNSRLLINASGFYLPNKSCCYLKYLYFSNSTFTRINYFIFYLGPDRLELIIFDIFKKKICKLPLSSITCNWHTLSIFCL